jgi:hypothetical protein
MGKQMMIKKNRSGLPMLMFSKKERLTTVLPHFDNTVYHK